MNAVAVTPLELAAIVGPRLGSSLVAFDVDGVLAPIVDHADDAVLSPGIADRLDQLSRRTLVAVVSGRSLDSLERLFAFPDAVVVIGSHGLERRHGDPIALDEPEQVRYDKLTTIGQAAVDDAGVGAWLEYKPASVVVHTRLSEVDSTAVADEVAAAVDLVGGASAKRGHDVVELFARSTSKAVALEALRHEVERDGTVFFGDDVTDEEAFERFGPNDLGVRVGPGATAARLRLDNQGLLVEVLGQLVGWHEGLDLVDGLE